MYVSGLAGLCTRVRVLVCVCGACVRVRVCVVSLSRKGDELEAFIDQFYYFHWIDSSADLEVP